MHAVVLAANLNCSQGSREQTRRQHGSMLFFVALLFIVIFNVKTTRNTIVFCFFTSVKLSHIKSEEEEKKITFFSKTD
jgi:predicted membrane protein